MTVEICGVGLAGKVSGNAQAYRLVAQKPRLREACAQSGVVCSAGLEPYGKVLSVSKRNRPPGLLLEHSLDGEVVEAQSQGSHKGIASPASGKFHVAVRFFLQIICDINRILVCVRNHIIASAGLEYLRVEMSD